MHTLYSPLFLLFVCFQAVAAVATAVAYRLELALGDKNLKHSKFSTKSSTTATEQTDNRQHYDDGSNNCDVNDKGGSGGDGGGCDGGGDGSDDDDEDGDDSAADWLKQVSGVGLLLSFESLLSTTGQKS